MKNNKRSLSKIFHYFIYILKENNKYDKKLFFFSLLQGLIAQIIELGSIFLPVILINFISNHIEPYIIYGTLFIIVLLLCLSNLFMNSILWSIEVFSIRASMRIHTLIANKIFGLDYGDLETSDGINSIRKGQDGYDNTSDVDFYIINILLWRIVSLLILSYLFISIDIKIFAIVLLKTIISFVLDRYKERVDYQYNKELKICESRIKYLKKVLTDVTFQKDLRLYNSLNVVIEKLKEINGDKNRIQSCKSKKKFIIDVIKSMCSLIVTIMIYCIAIHKYTSGNIEIGYFMVFVTSAQTFLNSISSIYDAISYILSVRVYMDDFNNFINRPNQLKSGELSLPDSIESIEFRNVCFSYPNQSNIETLHNINFKLYKNQRIALVGDNGAGKSTVIKLLLHLYEPSSGEIFINDTNICEFNYEQYMSLFSTVFQDFSLFDYTLEDNILCGFDKDDLRLNAAIKKSGFDGKISSLPDGYKTYVNKRFSNMGIAFSGGEKNKIALSRAIYKNAKVIILDEPYSGIDPIIEYDLHQRMMNLNDSDLLLFVCHRLTSCRLADRILVLDNGRIVEEGTHMELIENKGIYANMYEKQRYYYTN